MFFVVMYVMNGMKGILAFSPTTTAGRIATLSTATGQKVISEFITEALKHSRFSHQPTGRQRSVENMHDIVNLYLQFLQPRAEKIDNRNTRQRSEQNRLFCF